MAKEKGLGRGLSALFGSEVEEKSSLEPVVGESIQQVDIEQLIPGRYQPRSVMNEDALNELAESIAEQGLMQPIIARQLDDGYEIIAGERRWRAAQIAKIKEVPVIIREISDRSALAMALIENIQREDLSALEEANGIRRMIDEFEMTHEQAADALGKSRVAVSNLLRLLNLTPHVRKALAEKKIEMGHARALLPLNPDRQIMLCEKIARESLSVREVEALVNGEDRSKCFHSIRKFVVTTLEQGGVAEGIAADLVGHEKPNITYNVYSGGSSIEQLSRAVEVLDRRQQEE